MTHQLPRPHGDPDQIDTVVKRLRTVATGLKDAATQAKSGAGMAITGWDAPNVKYFTDAAAGIQWQLTSSQSAAENTANALAAYSKILRAAQEEVDRLQRQADAHEQSSAGSGVLMPSAHSASTGPLTQHGRPLKDLEADAQQQVHRAQRSAKITTALINDVNDGAVPGSTKLTTAQIARKVSERDGAADIRSALAKHSVTPTQAWKALKQPGTEVPQDAINSDGSINDTQFDVDLLEAVEGTYGTNHRTPTNPDAYEPTPWAVASSARLLKQIAATQQKYFPPPAPPKGESLWEWAKKHPVEAGLAGLGVAAATVASAGAGIEFGVAGSAAADSGVGAVLMDAGLVISAPGLIVDAIHCARDPRRNSTACVAAAVGIVGGFVGEVPRLTSVAGAELPTVSVLSYEAAGYSAGTLSFTIDNQSVYIHEKIGKEK